MMIEQPVILFDGVCNFCNGGINFVMQQDKQKILRFGTLQSTAAQELLKKYNLSINQFDSFVFIDKNKAYMRSTAALLLMNKLPWYWKWTQVFWIVPLFIRDGIYNFIARNRYKWFGRKDACMIPSAEIRSRFLD